ncbi:hypothetical protein BOX15_Mlig014157g1 [Macrostomum lignano]|uniref:non-specific serine/threonine protein kinase n=1 Tax=Macrostomum lignano TaxID=282301 RepID=A0A267H244_9PLAT|nr:hypothetical protein BOX15_Mlig014157g1 [Macrostomum lignano]
MESRQSSTESNVTMQSVGTTGTSSDSATDVELLENSFGTVDLDSLAHHHHQSKGGGLKDAGTADGGATASLVLAAGNKRLGSYQLMETIGKGTFALVKLGYHTVLKTRVAIKIMDKDLIGDNNLIKVYREIEAMKCLRHPYIIRLYEVIETASQVCLVMEFASKGEVFDYITRVKHLPETEAREIFWQTVCAVSYCHHRRIAHRDLKAENLLLDYRGCVKLVDFGFCNVMQPNELLNTHCGSPQYASPELFKGEAYDGIKVDVWSLGVILYVLVCGSFPFCGEHLGTIKASVMRGLVRFPFYLSHSCESLIRWMLNSDPVKRCSIEQVCCSPWMRSSPNWPAYAELMQHYASTKPAAAAPEAEELDPAVLSLLSDNFGYDASQVAEAVQRGHYNSLGAAYRIAVDKLERRDAQAAATTTAVTDAELSQLEFYRRTQLNLRRHTLSAVGASATAPMMMMMMDDDYESSDLVEEPAEAAATATAAAVESRPDPAWLNNLPQLNLLANLPPNLHQPIACFTVKDPNLLAPPDYMVQTAPQFPRRASDGAARRGGISDGASRGNSCPEDSAYLSQRGSPGLASPSCSVAASGAVAAPGAPVGASVIPASSTSSSTSSHPHSPPSKIRSASSSPKSAAPSSRRRLSASTAGGGSSAGPFRRHGSYKERGSCATRSGAVDKLHYTSHVGGGCLVGGGCGVGSSSGVSAASVGTGSRRRSEGSPGLLFHLSRGGSAFLHEFARSESPSSQQRQQQQQQVSHSPPPPPPPLIMQQQSLPPLPRPRHPTHSESEEEDLAAIESLNAKLRAGSLTSSSAQQQQQNPLSPAIALTDETGQVINIISGSAFNFSAATASTGDAD